MEKNIQDKDLGVITLRTTPRATRYTLKISKGKITATMPPGGDEKRMIAFIMENKPKLIKALQKHPARPLINEQTQLQATTFQTHIFRTERENFYMRLEEGILHIACPLETCFEREEVQSLLKSMLEKAFRHEASHLRSLIRLRNEFLIWEMIRILEQIQDIWSLRGRDIKSLF